MIRAFRRWRRSYATLALMHDMVEQLEVRLLVLMGDLWYRRNRRADPVTRILISGGEVERVTGTELDVRRAAATMARRTKSCVMVTAVVGHHTEGSESCA